MNVFASPCNYNSLYIDLAGKYRLVSTVKVKLLCSGAVFMSTILSNTLELAKILLGVKGVAIACICYVIMFITSQEGQGMVIHFYSD